MKRQFRRRQFTCSLIQVHQLTIKMGMGSYLNKLNKIFYLDQRDTSKRLHFTIGQQLEKYQWIKEYSLFMSTNINFYMERSCRSKMNTLEICSNLNKKNVRNQMKILNKTDLTIVLRKPLAVHQIARIMNLSIGKCIPRVHSESNQRIFQLLKKKYYLEKYQRYLNQHN